MALLDFLPAIKSAVVGPLRTVLLQVRTAFDTTIHIVDTMHEIIDDAVGIIHEIKTFEIKPDWKTRVLSVPSAIDNVKDLIEVPARIGVAVKDLVTRLKSKLGPGVAAQAEAEAALEEASGLEGSLLRIFPRLGKLLARGIGKLVGIVAIVVEGIVDVSNALADIKVLVGQSRVALESLNHLDVVFLDQQKKRKTLRLEDGSTIRIRVPRRQKQN